MRTIAYLYLALGMVVSTANAAVLNGNAFTLRSTGSASGSAWTLDRDGYLGTYITLAAPGDVTIGVSASGTASGGIDPNMNVVIGDMKAGFDVKPGTGNYSHTYSLPAGTFFVRTEFNNDVSASSRALKVNSMTVTGATLSNTNSNANALAASDTYIANYRKGNATIAIPGLAPGAQVGVSLKRIGFDWGADIDYTMQNNLTDTSAAALNFQAKVNQNFNALATGNEMWKDTEATRGQPTMGDADTLATYAAAHGMTARLHNMLWDDQQPSWVNSLKSRRNTTDLRKAISSRIGYFIGGEANKFGEVDVYNEPFNGGQNGSRSSYWNEYGASGVASIYKEAAAAVKAAGGNMKLMINDYGGLEGYATSGYMKVIEAIQAAGYGSVIGGIDLEDYAAKTSDHSAATVISGLQTFNVTGLPTQLSEFGTYTGVSTTDSAKILGEEMRLMFGNPGSIGFANWYWVKLDNGSSQFAPNGALYTVANGDWANMTLTSAGKIWQDQLGIQDWDGNANNGWTTQLTAAADANGAISFNGYYGDYQVTINGSIYNLSLVKGTTNYTITLLGADPPPVTLPVLMTSPTPVPEPATILLALVGGFGLWAVARRR
jgi:GH35 family endo-1,4-beta-xylanase